MSLLKVDLTACDRDGACVDVCPLGILELDPEGGPRVLPNAGHHCIGCGHCVAVCPHGALDNARNPLSLQDPCLPGGSLDRARALEFLRTRRSVRRYRKEAVPRDTLLQLLEASRYAPSGHNSQGLSYIIVEDGQVLRQIGSIVIEWMREFCRVQEQLARSLHMSGVIRSWERGEDRVLRDAPQLIAACAPKDLLPARVTAYLALEYVELYATTLGLGTCWAGYAQVCAQQHPGIPRLLRLSSDKEIVGMMMVGYPLYSYHRLPYRNPVEVVWHEPS